MFDTVIVSTNTLKDLLTKEQFALVKQISDDNKISFQTKDLKKSSQTYSFKRNRLYLVDGKKDIHIKDISSIRISTYIKVVENNYWASFIITFKDGKKDTFSLFKFEEVESSNEVRAAKLRQIVAKEIIKRENTSIKNKYQPPTNSFLRLIKKLLSLFK